MWYAKYNNVKLNGFEPTVTVTVMYYSDIGDSAYHESINLMPVQIDSEEFKSYIQTRLSVLNGKQASVDVTGIDIHALNEKPIGDAPPKEAASVVSG